MKFTLDWLKDYLDTDASADEIAERLTAIGLEIDDVITEPAPIAAKIVECEDIHDTHLHKLKVDDGSGELRDVVCGAPNARAGLVSALALPGCKIGGIEIKAGNIRGHISNGMMCSEKELGLSNNHDGIVELDKNSEVGKPLTAVGCGLTTIFDAGITPNRPDYLSVRGIARDLAASGIGRLQPTAISPQPSVNKGARKAVIENEDACYVYSLCEIHGIKMAPSNPKIAGRLSAIGINPKNACIDATNYVCYDMGQPMHCFDADEINGDIIIRNAKHGEKFTDLFGAEHELIDADLVIADADGILALAGIIGGARGCTTDKTKNIILESAYFEPIGIRKTAKRLGISTDASYRYERGIDPTIAQEGAALAARIIVNKCDGEIVGSFTAVRAQSTDHRSQIKYSPKLFHKITGIDLAADKQKEILEKLGYIVNDDWTIKQPSWRVDDAIPEVLVSDILRIYGYENIKSTEHRAQSINNIVIESIKSKLASLGLVESITFGFGDSEKEKLLSDKPSILIKNPIIETMNTARNGLVQNMLDVIANNDRFRRSNLNLFELGTVFDGDMPGQEHKQLIIACTGIAGDNIGAKHGRNVEIYDVRDDLLELFLGAKVENDTAALKWGNPYRAGRIVQAGKIVAQFAELHPMIAKKFGIKTNVVLGIVNDTDVIPEPAQNPPRPAFGAATPPREGNNDFPLITRDFAFVVDNKVSPDDIVSAIRSTFVIVYETNVFDVFDMGDGKKSVALELILQPTTNMSDNDLLEFQSKVIAAVESKFDAKIRDK
jgi:phenylalanyl-tRNA synthetase beta chain